REIFNKKQPGDPLAAEHVNDLSRVFRRHAGFSAMPATFGSGGGLTNSAVFRQNIVQIVANLGADLYSIRLRQYNHALAAWETDNNAGPYSLDAADFDVDVLPGD